MSYTLLPYQYLLIALSPILLSPRLNYSFHVLVFLREKEEEVKESMRERAEKQSITRKSIGRKGREGEGARGNEISLSAKSNHKINVYYLSLSPL